jgi:hypothetical protein
LCVDTELAPLTTCALRRALSGVCAVVVRVMKCYPCGELQARCAMECDTDKVDETVLALLFLTMFDEDQHGARAWKGHERRNGSAAREGLHLRPQEQGQIGRGDRARRAATPQTVRETPRRKNRKCVSGRLSGDSNRAIPKQEEGTGADHDPSSPVPQRTRNALRLRCASGR